MAICSSLSRLEDVDQPPRSRRAGRVPLQYGNREHCRVRWRAGRTFRSLAKFFGTTIPHTTRKAVWGNGFVENRWKGRVPHGDSPGGAGGGYRVGDGSCVTYVPARRSWRARLSRFSLTISALIKPAMPKVMPHTRPPTAWRRNMVPRLSLSPLTLAMRMPMMQEDEQPVDRRGREPNPETGRVAHILFTNGHLLFSFR